MHAVCCTRAFTLVTHDKCVHMWPFGLECHSRLALRISKTRPPAPQRKVCGGCGSQSATFAFYGAGALNLAPAQCQPKSLSRFCFNMFRTMPEIPRTFYYKSLVDPSTCFLSVCTSSVVWFPRALLLLALAPVSQARFRHSVNGSFGGACPMAFGWSGGRRRGFGWYC